MTRNTRAIIGYGGFAVALFVVFVVAGFISTGNVFTSFLMVLSGYAAAAILAWIIFAVSDWVEGFKNG